MKKRIIVGIIYLILLAIVIAISLSIFPAWKSSGGFKRIKNKNGLTATLCVVVKPKIF